MTGQHRHAMMNRLKTARGHLDTVIRMVDEETYCPQGDEAALGGARSLARASRIVLRNHLETLRRRGDGGGTDRRDHR